MKDNLQKEELPIVDFTQLLRTIGGDKEDLKELLQCFLEEYPIQQGNIEKAVKNKDAVLLKKHCHKMKGSLQLLRATECYNLVCELEKLSISSDLKETPEICKKLCGELERLSIILDNKKKTL
ncbi:Hpt domain-containing protein [Clostridium sp. PL3]|uniref:Hpt domain-containing protein n=1 Tax=Clostridium thailandense TaxID=2794346 RepID=A0A949TMW3_9CLOT|nr:Hpt domain-containing protein [Clostridium thailandense]MBV7273377.1 Hpt domain-containing protein [Clostridium thailandense]